MYLCITKTGKANANATSSENRIEILAWEVLSTLNGSF